MTTATVLRATALPMPVLEMTGEKHYVGKRATLLPVAMIGNVEVLVAREGIFVACWKCSGAGVLPHLMMVFDGVCFGCNGSGVSKFAADADKACRKVRSAQAREARKAAQWEAEAPARAAEHVAYINAQHEEALGFLAAQEAKAAAAEARLAETRYAGEIGAKKVTVSGIVATATSHEGDYGISRFVIVVGMGDDMGITVKISGTSEWLFDAERGDNVTVTGTVKAHATYNNARQTVMIRTKRV